VDGLCLGYLFDYLFVSIFLSSTDRSSGRTTILLRTPKLCCHEFRIAFCKTFNSSNYKDGEKNRVRV
jgi:hypothetical protein